MSLVRNNILLQQILKTNKTYPLIGIINVETNEVFFAPYFEGIIVDSTSVHWSQDVNSIVDAIKKNEAPHYNKTYTREEAQKFLANIKENVFIPAIEKSTTVCKTAAEILLEQSSINPDKNQWIVFEPKRNTDGRCEFTFVNHKSYLSLRKQTQNEQENLTSVLDKKFNSTLIGELTDEIEARKLQKLKKTNSQNLTSQPMRKQAYQFNNQTQEHKMPTPSNEESSERSTQKNDGLSNGNTPKTNHPLGHAQTRKALIDTIAIHAKPNESEKTEGLEAQLLQKQEDVENKSESSQTKYAAEPPLATNELEIKSHSEQKDNKAIRTQPLKHIDGLRLLVRAKKITLEQCKQLNTFQANILANAVIAQDIIDGNKDLTEFLAKRDNPFTVQKLGETLNYILVTTNPSDPDAYRITGVIESKSQKENRINTIFANSDVQKLVRSGKYSEDDSADSQVANLVLLESKEIDNAIEHNMISVKQVLSMPEGIRLLLTVDNSSAIAELSKSDKSKSIAQLLTGSKLTIDQYLKLLPNQVELLGKVENAQEIIGKNLTPIEFLLGKEIPLLKRALEEKEINEQEALLLSKPLLESMKNKDGIYLLVEDRKLNFKKADEIIKNRPDDFILLQSINVAKKIIADNISVDVYFNELTSLDKLKLLFENKKNKSDFTIEQMNDLFCQFDRSSLIHQHSWLDRKVGLVNTASFQKFTNEIRHEAFEKLNAKIMEISNGNQSVDDKNEAIKALLENAKTLTIFNRHSSNFKFTGAWGRTGAVNAIDIMLNNLKKARIQGRTLGHK